VSLRARGEGVESAVRRQPFVLVVSGPSGAGKSTFVARLLKRFPDMKFSVSATTRPLRGGETDGLDYHFLSEAEFQRRVEAGEFLEHAGVFGDRYGTLRSEVFPALESGRLPLLDLDVQGGVRVKEQLPEAVLIFILPPSMAVLEARLRGRKTESEERIQRRLRRAPDEIRCLAAYDYVVVNAEIATTEAELEAIVCAERLRRARLTDDAGGPGVAAEYLGESARPLAP
jgi:guanylate kinase